MVFLYQDFLFGEKYYVYTKAGFGGDDYRLYLPALNFFREWIANPSLYSLNIAAGEDIFAWSNVFFDPFNWIALPFEPTTYPTLLLYIQIIKHALIFLAGYLLIKEMNWGETASLTGSMCFASAASVFYPQYFLVTFYLLTLVYLLAIERTLNKKGHALTVLSIFFMALISIYALYKLAIFTAFYLLARLLIKNLSSKKVVVINFHFFVIALLTLLTASILVMPIFDLYLGSDRSDAQYFNLSYLGNWIYNAELIESLMGVGPAALLALPSLYLLSNRGRLIALAATIVLILFTSNIWFISLTTGFAKPTEFYTNFLYAVPLILAISHTISGRQRLNRNTWLIVGAILALVSFYFFERWSAGFETAFLGAIMLIASAFYFGKTGKQASMSLLIILIGFQTFWARDIIVNYSETHPTLVTSDLTREGTHGRLLANSKTGGFLTGSTQLNRVKKTYTVSGLNDSLLFNYRGTEAQHSATNSNYHSFAKEYFRTAPSEIQVFNSSINPSLDHFMGVSKIVSQGKLIQPLNYKEEYSERNLHIYSAQSENLGLFVNRYLTPRTFEGLDRNQRNWQLHNAVYVENKISGMQQLTLKDIPKIANNIQLVQLGFEVTSLKPKETIYRIDIPNDLRQLALALNLRFKQQAYRELKVIGIDIKGNRFNALSHRPSITLDSVNDAIPLASDRPDFAFELQLYQYATLIVHIFGPNSDSLSNVYLPLQQVSGYQHQKQNSLAKVDLAIEGSDIKGEIEALDAGVVVLQLPFHENWELQLNDSAQEVLNVNHGLMGFHIENPGKYQVSMNYRLANWWLSLTLTFLGILLISIYLRAGPKFIGLYDTP